MRRELIFYARPGGDDVAAMQFLALLPVAENAYIDQSHTIKRAVILFARGDVDTELPHVVLLAPLLRHHAALRESLEIDGDSVEFLSPLPISAAEHAIVQEEYASDAFMDVLVYNEHPCISPPTARATSSYRLYAARSAASTRSTCASVAARSPSLSMTWVARRTFSSCGQLRAHARADLVLVDAVAADDAREPGRRRRGDDDEAVQLLAAAALDQQRRLVERQRRGPRRPAPRRARATAPGCAGA